jgi:hypothetical protein
MIKPEDLPDFIVDSDYAAFMEKYVRETLDELEVALEADLDDQPETPSGMPWDGCEICQTRETMTMTVQLVIEGMKHGYVSEYVPEHSPESDPEAHGYQFSFPGI